MRPILAQMFEGMEWIPLIGIGIAAIVFLVFAGVAFAILCTFFRRRWVPLAVLSAVLGAAPVVGFLLWSTHYNAPLRLPSGAREVRISRTFPFALGIDDNLRFRLSESEFRSWIESLCGQSWQSIQSEAWFEAFTNGRCTTMTLGASGQLLRDQVFTPPWGSDVLPWMDTSMVKNGCCIYQNRAFPGRILYDSDTELVYYYFWH